MRLLDAISHMSPPWGKYTILRGAAVGKRSLAAAPLPGGRRYGCFPGL